MSQQPQSPAVNALIQKLQALLAQEVVPKDAYESVQRELEAARADDATDDATIARLQSQMAELEKKQASSETYDVWQNKMINSGYGWHNWTAKKLGLPIPKPGGGYYTPEEFEAALKREGGGGAKPPVVPGITFKLIKRVRPSSTTALGKALAQLEASKKEAIRWPNATALLERKDLDQRAMRQLQSDTHRTIIEHLLYGDPKSLQDLAGWYVRLEQRMKENTQSTPEGRLTSTYREMFRKGKNRLVRMLGRVPSDDEVHAYVDQPGIPRLLTQKKSKENPDGFDQMAGTHFLELDHDLKLGHIAEGAEVLSYNLSDPPCKRGYEAAMRILTIYLIPILSRWAEIKTGDKDRLDIGGHTLWHPIVSKYCAFASLYRITGEAYWKMQAERLWGYMVKQLYEVKLPDGNTGLITTHGVIEIEVMTGRLINRGWQWAVYVEESAPHMLIHAWLNDAAGLEGGFTLEHVRKHANLLYWTLPKHGWGASKISRDIGGGGINDPKATKEDRKGLLQFANGSSARVPEDGYVTEYGEVEQGLSPQRGLSLIGAAYSDIPDYADKLRTLDKTARPERSAVRVALALVAAREAGELPGVRR